MNRFTVEETNLIVIYNENGKQGVIDNITAALPYMDADMRELAQRTISKVDALTLEEYTQLVALSADEV
ncbi:transposon-transfer assisting family protein [Lactococcus lactis]|uniref:transposon-transfer assisting family protein n=1 Tax=Lactococcus lactis TaxID=1358 RepID=UPI00288DE788|nr:transposon-transfer assisting family protein [Lactococcus lactis]MDT2935512.1 transposon-transfer assisting family protein [Lactococcus lactis]